MKRSLITLILVALLASACAPMALAPEPTATPTPVPPTPAPSPTPASAPRTPAEQAALKALAEALGVAPDLLKFIGSESVQWRDGCLELGQPDMACLQAIVPGYRVSFEYKGRTYEVHTDEAGSAVALGQPLFRAWAALQIVQQQLANKFGDTVEFRLVSIEAVDWPDSCLGISSPEARCATAITPGYRMVWEVKGKRYTYHTNAEGTAVAEAVALLKWDRQGGIAGFCDFLIANTNGEVFYGQCGQPEKQGELTEAELAQLKQWGGKFAAVVIDASDPENVSDRMTVMIQLSALGTEQPTRAERQAMLDWTQAVYTRLP
jgi:hypothetical protein